MALAEFAVHLRLLSPVLLTFVAWIVWRTPYQERANRKLAAFLAVLAIGFALEVLWDMARHESDRLAGALRTAQDVLGYVDPPLLVAFALAVARPRGRAPGAWLYGTFAVVGAGIFLLGTFATGDLRGNLFPAARILYVNGAYLAAFVLLLETFRHEERRFMARQLRFVVMGVGFAAASRSAALFLIGGPVLLRGPTLATQMLWSALVTLVLLLVIGWGFGMRARRLGRARRPVGGVLAWVGAMTLGFYLVWFLVGTSVSGLGFGVVLSFYFPLRWVVVAGVVSYGILRFQLFDFELRSRQVVALLVALVAGIVAAMFAGDLAIRSGLARMPAQLIGVPVVAAVGVPVFLIAERLGRTLESDEERERREHERRLEVYQATLEFALEKPDWNENERRFVETLREVFGVTPEEHERVVGRLRERLPVGQGRAPGGQPPDAS